MARAERYLTVLFLLFACVIVVYSFQYGVKSRTFPLAIGLATVLLCAGSLWKGRNEAQKEEVQEGEKGEEATTGGRPLIRLILWSVAAVALLPFVSYLYVLPLLVFLLLWLEAGEKWPVALAVGLGTGIFFYLVFVRIFGSTFG